VVFKSLVDDQDPFRYLIIILTLFISFVYHGGYLLYIACTDPDEMRWPDSLPQLNLIKMALADFLTFSCIVMGGTLTTAPLTALLVHSSSLIYPLIYGEEYSPLQKKGTYLSLAGVGVAVLYPVIFHPNQSLFNFSFFLPSRLCFFLCNLGWPTLLFLLGYGPLTVFSTVVKEKQILSLPSPTNPIVLSTTLHLYEFLLGLILCIPTFLMMNVDTSVTAGDFKTYFGDGMGCFFKGEDPSSIPHSEDDSSCSTSFLLLLSFTLSTSLLIYLSSKIDSRENPEGDMWLRRVMVGSLLITFPLFLLLGHSITLTEIIGAVLMIAGQEVFNQQENGSDTLEVISTFSP